MRCASWMLTRNLLMLLNASVMSVHFLKGKDQCQQLKTGTCSAVWFWPLYRIAVHNYNNDIFSACSLESNHTFSVLTFATQLWLYGFTSTSSFNHVCSLVNLYLGVNHNINNNNWNQLLLTFSFSVKSFHWSFFRFYVLALKALINWNIIKLTKVGREEVNWSSVYILVLCVLFSVPHIWYIV